MILVLFTQGILLNGAERNRSNGSASPSKELMQIIALNKKGKKSAKKNGMIKRACAATMRLIQSPVNAVFGKKPSGAKTAFYTLLLLSIAYGSYHNWEIIEAWLKGQLEKEKKENDTDAVDRELIEEKTEKVFQDLSKKLDIPVDQRKQETLQVENPTLEPKIDTDPKPNKQEVKPGSNPIVAAPADQSPLRPRRQLKDRNSETQVLPQNPEKQNPPVVSQEQKNQQKEEIKPDLDSSKVIPGYRELGRVYPKNEPSKAESKPSEIIKTENSATSYAADNKNVVNVLPPVQESSNTQGLTSTIDATAKEQLIKELAVTETRIGVLRMKDDDDTRFDDITELSILRPKADELKKRIQEITADIQ